MNVRDFFSQIENVSLKDVKIPVNKLVNSVVKPDRAKGEILVKVNVPKFDKAWARERSFYIGKGGTGNAIGMRYKNFIWILTLPEEERKMHLMGDSKKGQIAAPEVSVREDGTIDFTNGRHRYSVLRDLGAKKIPVSMTPESARNAKKWGYI